MAIVLQSTGGGSVSIQEPTTASNFTQTLPASTGTVMVSGNMPAFSAYGGTVLSSSGVNTKIPFNAERFDTANAYDSVTNFRFQPLVAGYYQINATIGTQAGSGIFELDFYKNGSNYFYGTTVPNNVSSGPQVGVSTTVYLNGSTDYMECYGYQNTGSTKTLTGYDFSGSLVRAA
jgi:hypothetical protein